MDDVVKENTIRNAPGVARLNPVRPLIDGALNWGWIVAVIAIGEHFGWNGLTIGLALIVTGVHMHRNAIIGHDGAHYLITRNRRLNDLYVNLLFFWSAFATVSGYRDWHFRHHRWVGTERDPEREVKCGPRYRLPKKRWRLIGECALDMFGYGANEVTRLQWAIRPKRPVEYLGPVCWWAVVGGVLILTGLGHVIAILIGALLTTFWSVYRLRGWCEHLGVEGTHRFTTNGFMKYVFFPHNTWCHYEHHRWPYLPYYALPAARARDTEVPVSRFADVLAVFERAPDVANGLPAGSSGGGKVRGGGDLAPWWSVPAAATECAAT